MPLSRRSKIALGVLTVFVLAAGLFVFSARRFFFPERLDVVSIKTLPAYQDPALLARAYALPAASHYDHAGFLFQPNGSLCGPTSVANVARSLGNARATPADVVLGTGKCEPMGVCWGGISLDELAVLARDFTHRAVAVRRDLELDQFRALLRESNDPSRRVILNFDRGPLFGTAGGHHSPVGGYLADEDLVLVLDVNKKYAPWLVSSERLFAAMNTVDPSTGKKRGALVIE